MIDAYWFGAREENGLVYAGKGNELGWRDGEERTVTKPERIEMCSWGYHAARSWLDALKNAPGPVACRVQLEVADFHNGKMVGPRRKLITHVDASRELRLFAADCAERVLLRERKAGREPDKRSWAAVEAARAFARGEIDMDALRNAANAAYRAANAANAAYDAANAANAAYAANDAIYTANAANAAYAVDQKWLQERLDCWMEQAFLRNKQEGVGISNIAEIDATCSHYTDGTYRMSARCANCGIRYVLVLSKGYRFPGYRFPSYSGGPKCPNCGCNTWTKEVGKFGESAGKV